MTAITSIDPIRLPLYTSTCVILINDWYITCNAPCHLVSTYYQTKTGILLSTTATHTSQLKLVLSCNEWHIPMCYHALTSMYQYVTTLLLMQFMISYVPSDPLPLPLFSHPSQTPIVHTDLEKIFWWPLYFIIFSHSFVGLHHLVF